MEVKISAAADKQLSLAMAHSKRTEEESLRKHSWPPGRNTNGPMTNCWFSKGGGIRDHDQFVSNLCSGSLGTETRSGDGFVRRK